MKVIWIRTVINICRKFIDIVNLKLISFLIFIMYFTFVGVQYSSCLRVKRLIKNLFYFLYLLQRIFRKYYVFFCQQYFLDYY